MERVREIERQIDLIADDIAWTATGTVEEMDRMVKERTLPLRIERKKLLVLDQMEKSGFSKRQLNHSFDNYQENNENEKIVKKAHDYIENFETHFHDGTGIIMTGTPGTGKTHLMTAILKEILFRDKTRLSVKAGSFMKMLYEIKSNFAQETDVINEFSNYDLLFLDDLGKEMITDWSRQILYLLINERYENFKPTFITTNCSGKELSEKLDEATVSRFHEVCAPFKFGKNADFRKTSGL